MAGWEMNGRGGPVDGRLLILVGTQGDKVSEKAEKRRHIYGIKLEHTIHKED